ncbi:MAG: autotransporter-associated beta strand repeat-containing protein, partial [Actinomycetes bacterium]
SGTPTLAINRGVTLGASGGTFQVDSGTLTAGSVITGTGTGLALTKTGTGTLVLGSNNSYVGKTSVLGGILQISSDTSLGIAPSSPDSTHLTLSGGTLQTTTTQSFTLAANRGIQLGTGGGTFDVGGDITLTESGNMSGAGNLTKTGSGTLQTNHANTYTGKTIIRQGALAIGRESSLGIAPSSATADQLTLDGGTLEATNSFNITSTNRGITLLSGGGTIQVDSDFTLQIGTVIAGTGNLTMTGSGYFNPTATNTYTGTTTVNGGTLQINDDSRLGHYPGAPAPGQLTINDATLEATGTFAIGSNRGITIGGTTIGATIDVDPGYVLTANSVIAGSGNLTKADLGQLYLTTTSSFTGTTAVNSGTLTLGGSGALASGNAVSVNSGATIAGTGHAQGTVALSGVVSPGSSLGTLYSGTETWYNGGSYPVDITDATGGSGTGYDFLSITGDLSIPSSGFTISLTGTPSHFDNTGTYVWPIAKVTGTISGSVSNITFDRSGFTPALASGKTMGLVETAHTDGTNNWTTIDIVYGRDPTVVTVSAFKAYLSKNHVVAAWKTSSPGDTVGFYLYRKVPATGKWRQVNTSIVAARFGSPAGATYRVVDLKAPTGKRLTYGLKEIHQTGEVHWYGPYRPKPKRVSALVARYPFR